jgi:Protein of unknown function (DUF2950)
MLKLMAPLVVGVALLGAGAYARQSSNAQARAVSAPSGDAVSEKPNSKAFPTPAAAADALAAAAGKNDPTDMLVILGPHARDLVSWTMEQTGGDEDRQMFVRKYAEMHRLVKEPDNTVALYVGAENWPLPIPLVEYQGQWYFDTALGKQEILYRRLGRNETSALRVSFALLDAENEYFTAYHAYTDEFISDGKTHDGLYWPSSNNANRSPIGRYLAQAGISRTTTENRQCFHGYFYRILLQDHVAPDGDSKNPGDNGHGSFAIVAFPAAYRSSGVMTFLVYKNGEAYEKDLGPTSTSSALLITSVHPDNTWRKVE